MTDYYWSEKVLEQRLVQVVKDKGFECTKFESPGNRGVPDRIVWISKCRTDLVELKSTGQKPSKLQLWWHAKFRKLGYDVYVIDNMPDLLEYIKSL